METSEAGNFGRSLLMEAVEGCNLEKVSELLKEDIDINYKDQIGYTAFHRSIFSNIGEKKEMLESRNSIMSELISKGADVDSEINSFNSLGVTPLKSAIILNDKEAVYELIELGADINKEDKLDPYSPLMRAIAHSDLNIIRTIVNCGGDINYKNSVGEGLLHVFCMSNREEIFKELISKEISFRVNINDKTKQGMTPLMVACIYGNVDMVKYLVFSGANINLQDKKGNTALIWTITNPLDIEEEDRFEIVDILLKNNCNFKLCDDKGIGALEWSISKGYFEIATEIMNSYEDGENIVFERDGTPIHYAVSSRDKLKDRIEFISSAVKKGCDINYVGKTNKGILPINIAVAHLLGYKVDKIVKDELVLALVKNGASIVKGVLTSKRLGLNQEAVLENMI